MNCIVRRWIGVVLLTAIVVLTGCNQNKVLKVGMENNFRPFTYTEGGENKGFEVELWQEIAQKAGIRYELVPMESRELSPALKSGKVDLVIAGMTVNKARKDELAFSDPYFQTGLVMLTAQDRADIKSKDDLKGKTVATKLDTTAYTFTGAIPGLKEVKGYPDIGEAYEDLIANKVDCVIFDERNVHQYMQSAGNGKVKMVGEVLNKESYAIAGKKRNRYIGSVNSAIEDVTKNGTYEKLYMKWFGNKPAKLPGE
ncbi:transporter substrate-binding domain-containing protein [Paenibacillus mesophilus]|uniref:transporter substrate-binding domain-containing protein n=1 Tax=Paenibacillus mesophilus TaxID=2582849 RepID=UPI00110E9A43|nr:transporter substrate-binding domain-containing protein [Paenibacillus mesophilus]TMV50064.1 transporter substrate-binding domain-containing protein [Paenibacillus mesophilus]